ncbi:hypothetical protein A1359_17905 [Methylomonas lenta]|uniref:Uncharacterized protein n=1 Tax=Methylomonas lenta TaxID=980561 RepID=A0A177MW66_9GAMM|nr:hypothetical protein A1359_17905 [Methylomonas lenta]
MLRRFAVPEIPLDAVEHFQCGFSQFVLSIFIVEFHWQAFGDLIKYDQTHRDMEPIQQVFDFWVEIELQAAQGVAAIK